MTEPREVDVRTGYDRWSDTYDETPNPLVTLDRWHALARLDPRSGELILDAGCGTGGHFEALREAGAAVIGIDLSLGMLRRARDRAGFVPIAAVDLGRRLPFAGDVFDAVLCSLVSEHLGDPEQFFSEVRRILTPGGRLVFSGLHPERAADGVKASFDTGAEKLQMKAETHGLADFAEAARRSGLVVRAVDEHVVDQTLIDSVAKAEKYRGLPLLFVMTAVRPRSHPDSP